MSNPARLQRKKESRKIQIDQIITSFNKDRIEAWIITHAPFCLAILILLCMIIFILLCYLLVGVSATESGTVYNQFQNII